MSTKAILVTKTKSPITFNFDNKVIEIPAGKFVASRIRFDGYPDGKIGVVEYINSHTNLPEEYVFAGSRKSIDLDFKNAKKPKVFDNYLTLMFDVKRDFEIEYMYWLEDDCKKWKRINHFSSGSQIDYTISDGNWNYF